MSEKEQKEGGAEDKEEIIAENDQQKGYNMMKEKEAKKKGGGEKLIILLIISFIIGAIGATIGGYIFNAMRMIGDPWLLILIGFAIGFFAPIFIYMEFKSG